jgi:homoserine kinase type II
MGVFTQLRDDELVSVLAHFGVVARRVTGVVAGSVNTWFAVETDTETLFLRLDERRDVAAVDHELSLLHRLKALPVPQVRRTLAGDAYVFVRGLPALLFDALPGTPRLSHELTEASLAEVGRFMGAMHSVACPAEVGLHRFHPEMLVNRCYAPVRDRVVAEHAEAAQLLDAVFSEGVEAMHFADLPQAILHADLFADNLHYEGTQLVGVLDFEASGRGPRILDLAIAIHALCFQVETSRYDLARAEVLIKHYKSHIEIVPGEYLHWRAVLAYGAARFLVTRLRDFEFAGKPEIGVWKNYREYVAHLRAMKPVVEMF